MSNKLTRMLGRLADSLSEGEKAEIKENSRQRWTSGYGPREFGMAYIGSSEWRSRKIKCKKFANQRKHH